MMGFWDGSGISWTICKQCAPCSKQITTPTPHRSIFTGRMLLLTPNQQSQSTEGNCVVSKLDILIQTRVHASNSEVEKDLQFVWTVSLAFRH